MKKLKLTFVFVTSVFAAFSQDTTITRRYISDSLLFRGSHFSFSLIPFISRKATIDNETGPYTIGATALRGGEAGFDYQYNFNRFYSLRIGLHGTVNVRNVTFFVPKEDFTPPNDYDFEESARSSQTADFYLSVPVLFEKRWFTKKNNHWNIAAGIKIGYYPDQFSESGYWAANSQSFDALTLELEVGNNYKPWVDYLISGGHSWLLSNNNLFRLNILSVFSNIHIAKGQYLLKIPGRQNSTGSYASNFSYVGVSVSYVFTSTNKRLLKIYKTRNS